MKKILLLVGESGCGKSTLMKNLLKMKPLKYHLILSTTTRPPREKEVDGLDYHFRNHDYIQKQLESGQVVQLTEFGGNQYCTLRNEYQRPDREVGVLAVVPAHIKTIQEAFPDKEVKHVFFNVSNRKLREHLSDLTDEQFEERVLRGSIAWDYFQIYDAHSVPSGACWVDDCDIDDKLHIRIDKFIGE